MKWRAGQNVRMVPPVVEKYFARKFQTDDLGEIRMIDNQSPSGAVVSSSLGRGNASSVDIIKQLDKRAR